MKTLEAYEQEPHQETWWKRLLGTALSFVGLVLLTNAFVVMVPLLNNGQVPI
jgi:hypothetical protein